MTPPVVLINSGAYIPQELSAEFGLLPPAFLPVGMRRLYELQVEALSPLGSEIHLTLPESFEVPLWDQRRLAELGVTVTSSPDGLELGAAIFYALGRIGFEDRPLRVLHGDTLVTGIDLDAEDSLGVAPGADGYRWATVRLDEDRIASVTQPEVMAEAGERLRLTGWFAFASVARLARALALSRGDFFDALNRYAAETRCTPQIAGRWYDFGHVQTFFRSRRAMTTERAFNSLQIGDTVVRKRSADEGKLRAEALWLADAPAAVRPYIARLTDQGEDERGFYYETEYEHMPTLAELFVFGRLAEPAWRRVLSSCKAFMDAAADQAPPAPQPDVMQRLAVGKTEQRLAQFARTDGLDLDAGNRLNGAPAPSFRRCLEDVAAVLRTDPPRPALMHGDFCFSNILYNVRTERVRLLDPRGAVDERGPSLYGDARYDAAKLMHSIRGRYDQIIAGRCAAARSGANQFSIEFPDDGPGAWLEAAAADLVMGGVRLDGPAVTAATVSLFLSMPPLHADRPDRQWAFLANALRLHRMLETRSP